MSTTDQLHAAPPTITSSRKTDGFCGPCAAPDRVDGTAWAAALLLGGLVLLAQVAGIAQHIAGWDGWSVWLTGAGAIVWVATLARLLRRELGRASFGLLLGGALVSVGLRIEHGLTVVGATALVLVGLSLIRGARRR